MDLPEEFAHKTISSMLAEHPRIGEILGKHRIDCVTCGSSACLFKNVIATHTFDPQRAIQIEEEIHAYLAGLSL